MTRYLLDTTEVIQILRGNKAKGEQFERIADRGDLIGCCGITITEVYYGMKESEAPMTDAFFSGIGYYPITIEAAKLAGLWRREYRRKGYTITLNDSIIAAVAHLENAILLTENRRDYPMMELKVIDNTECVE